MNWNPYVRKDGKRKRGKKAVLEDMLAVIDQTEACHLDPDGRQRMARFASATTLEGWRLSIRSAIDLTEELLNLSEPMAKYRFVLSAKWNQDVLEVIKIPNKTI